MLKSKKKLKTCDKCGEQYETYVSRAKAHYVHNFCSRDCWRSFPRLPEVQAKMNKALTGEKNPWWGKAHSQESKDKMRLMATGRRHSAETRKKMSEARKGSNSSLWRGGKTAEGILFRQQMNYKDWRRAVFERDDYTCQFCGGKGARIEADHIKPFAIFPDLRLELSNGRTLCKPCHRSTDTWGVKASAYEK